MNERFERIGPMPERRIAILRNYAAKRSIGLGQTAAKRMEILFVKNGNHQIVKQIKEIKNRPASAKVKNQLNLPLKYKAFNWLK